MIGGLPSGVQVHLAAGRTDMRKGIDGLAALVQSVLRADPFSGHVFVFRGRAGYAVKLLFWDQGGFVLVYKRLERGHFVWPIADKGSVIISRAQLSLLFDGIDWRKIKQCSITKPSIAA